MKIYLILIGVLFFYVTSCGFLDLEPQQSIQEKDITTPKELDLVIQDAYHVMQGWQYYSRSYYALSGLLSDNVKYGPKASRMASYGNFAGTQDDTYALNLWSRCYQNILKANLAINIGGKLAPSITDAAELATLNHTIGEAYAIRAFSHFDLVRMFAQHYTFTSDASHMGIPVVQERTEKDYKPSKRNSVKEVYDAIIADYLKAISLMKEGDYSTSGNQARLSALAVQALLSRVYLYKEDWENAKVYANNVIQSGSYELIPNASYIATLFGENATDYTKESIFEIALSATDGGPGSNSLAYLFDAGGYDEYLPSTKLIEIIPKGDVRETLYENRAGFLRCIKYPIDSRNERNIYVVRLAEVYLTRAEAYAQLGEEEKARTDLAVIRQRGLPANLVPESLSGQDLIDEILTERRIELVLEGHRSFDLRRYKKDLVRSEDCGNGENGCGLIPYDDDRSNKLILPIPQNETSVSGLTQNPGY